MPNLSLIATEAHRLLKSLNEARRRELQEALIECCEAHWQALRGPQPAPPLAQALWSITPPWSDLLLDLHATGGAWPEELIPGEKLSNGLALLVLAEIERGNEMGVYIAHDPMMAFESTPPPADWLERITSLLRGTLAPPPQHRHSHRESLWKALAVIAAHTGRLDLPAVLQTIALLSAPADQASTAHDEALETLRHNVLETGVRFLSIEDNYLHLELHGHAHKPIRTRQLGEMLLEIRQQWLH